MKTNLFLAGKELNWAALDKLLGNAAAAAKATARQ
jgi:hypothetical protein